MGRLKTIVITLAVLLAGGQRAHAQFAVIDAQNAVNQILSYIQDGENALMNLEGIAEVFSSLENVHSALEDMQKIYNEVSPVIRDTKAVADIAVNYARVVEDWDRYMDYMGGLEDASYGEVKYAYYWGTRLVKNAAEDFAYAGKVVASRSLNMDDYQRYSQLQQLARRLSNIHRAFSGDLTEKEEREAQRKAMRASRSALRDMMR